MGKGGFSDRGIRSHTLSLAAHVLMGYPKGIPYRTKSASLERACVNGIPEGYNI